MVEELCAIRNLILLEDGKILSLTTTGIALSHVIPLSLPLNTMKDKKITFKVQFIPLSFAYYLLYHTIFWV